MSNVLVQFWKGSEAAYNELYKRGRIKDNVRYTVICENKQIKEYLGKQIINNGNLEQLAALDDVMSISIFQDKYKKGEISNCRLLVGDDNAFDSQGKLLDEYEPSTAEGSLWYAVIFNEGDSEPSQIIDFSNMTARIKSYKMKEYQVIDNVLTTYDHIIWHSSK